MMIGGAVHQNMSNFEIYNIAKFYKSKNKTRALLMRNHMVPSYNILATVSGTSSWLSPLLFHISICVIRNSEILPRINIIFGNMVDRTYFVHIGMDVLVFTCHIRVRNIP